MKVPVVARCMDERVTTPDFRPENPERPGGNLLLIKKVGKHIDEG